MSCNYERKMHCKETLQKTTHSQEKLPFFIQYLWNIYQKITISNSLILFLNTSTFPKNKKKKKKSLSKKHLEHLLSFFHETSDSMQQGRRFCSKKTSPNRQFTHWTWIFHPQPVFDTVLMITVFTRTQHNFFRFHEVFQAYCANWILDINFTIKKSPSFYFFKMILYNLTVFKYCFCMNTSYWTFVESITEPISPSNNATSAPTINYA